MPVLTVAGGGAGGAGGGGAGGGGGEMPKLKVVTFPRPPVSSSTAGAAPIKLTVVPPPSASSSSSSAPSAQAVDSQQQQQQQQEVEEDNMDEDEKALVDAEDTEGVIDKEMAAAVAGEAPVLLKEEGAIEAYTEARSEQQKQLEELKAKVRRGEENEGGREGGGVDGMCFGHTSLTRPSLPPSLPPSALLDRGTSRCYGRRQVPAEVGVPHGPERDVRAFFGGAGKEREKGEGKRNQSIE